MMKKIIKTTSFIFIVLILGIGLTIAGYILSIYLQNRNIKLDLNTISTSEASICIFDKNEEKIDELNTYSTTYTKLSQMPPYTYQAFISIEDKNFYKHNGINPKRIFSATINNIKNKSFSQGASTISQQLIKNTHLSSEKTIKRKIKEIILTRKMEKILSKEDILESYLNIIYFGNNCYGITEASDYYFSKTPQNLTLQESAMLAGIIKSPNKYSPIIHPEECLKRRNLVLSEMLKDRKITEEDYEKAIKNDLNLSLSITNDNNLNNYTESAIDEAIRILHLPAKQIALSGLKLHTYQNKDLQKKLENSLSEQLDLSDHAGIIINNKTHGIEAYYGKSAYKILDAKRQPGSCIKPLLVYAPALNEDIISPETQILDEKVKIGEYSPENIGGNYNGYVSVKTAISRSINIPAVKVLSYVGINKAKKYAENMGIKFDKKDDSYALALGGMTYGTNIKDLASAYSTFANNGVYSEGKFISYITNKEGKVIYKHIPIEKNILRKDTCYLMTEMLKETAKTGTAKKLNSLKIEVASKTGTVGKKGSQKNLDAWNISYTPEITCGIWAGNLDNTPINVAGGNQPTEVVKTLLEERENIPFEKPNEIVEREIDLKELEENHIVKLASSNTPARYKKYCSFSRFNLPETSNNFTIKTYEI